MISSNQNNNKQQLEVLFWERIKMKHHDSRGLAALALLSTCMASIDAHAADGTIHFTGEIVAAPYEMRIAARVPAPAPTVAHGTRGGGPVAELSFLRQYVDRPSASVRVDGLGALPLRTMFTDARGRRHHVDSAQAQAIGLDGGTLSIAAQQRPSAGRVAAAMVTVSYN
ncbi:hypothetical protein M2282_004223 [Variovorax boronicumulans]|uniref:hypothetical protein n=1 Tax=Variovorax boronicumulans TaxID=436515 RepID=UPI00247339EF|nr:hypothetical protein [Variovorax boronicumulans]MDH6169059.1 hypothetical protein [Variovorax boronicumulans]